MTETALPPGRMGLPLVGESIAFGMNPKRFVRRRAERYGPIFKSHLLGNPVVFMVGPEALRFVLVTHADHFNAREGWPLGLRELMGGSLMMRDGDEHDQARRLLAPAFFGPVLGDYVPVMEETTRRYLERWCERGEVVFYEELKRLSFDIASQLIFGAAPGGELERLHHLFSVYTRGMEGIHPMLRLPFSWTPFGRALEARKDLLRYITGLVERRRREPAADALGRMLEAQREHGGTWSDEEIATHALFLLFAGHESTTSLMTTFCLEMSRHPGALERAREEQRSLGDGPLDLEKVAAMTSLDRLLLEAERLYPPFSGAFRQVTKDFEFQGFHVPAGWKLFYAITGTHHAPDLYPEPEQYRPERFDDVKVAAKRRTCELAGFGAGKRSCLGIEFARLEARIILGLLLRDYRWTPVPGQDLDIVYIPSIYPKDGLRVKFERAT